ncbi:hypothetical protein CC78DRAFT_539447 [Lojkania enalia]|uniref:Histone-lysine N-methyltransferase SET9 n=1 Tax=Lojkania enalia TaxID=147567 RepID=A0A9P4NBJ3_9PLEO|nr:hypothetical protein CC78DRAFT_539447 [Didymosphaeria enalia]
MATKVAEKKGGLTLEKLALYDDVITDALVDKNRGGRFSASRGLHEEDIADILRNAVIVEKDPAGAVQQLLSLTGLRKFVDSLKDAKEKEHFIRHLRRYVNTYLPDSPFEVTTTNRYTISEHEASITARKEIKRGEEIKYLTGVQVAMTKEQEKTLELARKDFSLVISSRKKTRSLFLGPARFANHDCEPNAKLSTKGYDGMQIVAVKNIDIGEEITVSYGEDYFGDDNEECLCQTCENSLINGWAPFKAPEKDENEDDDKEEDDQEDATPTLKNMSQQEDICPFGRKRRNNSSSVEVSQDSSPRPKKVKLETADEKQPPTQSPRKSPPASPTIRRSPRTLRETTLRKTCSASNLRQEVPVSSIEDPSTNLAPSPQMSREIRTQQRVGLLTVTLDETTSSRDSTPRSSVTVGSPKSTQSTDATSVDEDAPIASGSEKQILAPAAIDVKPNIEVTAVETSAWSVWDDDSSELSELSASQDLDHVLQRVVKRKRSRTPTIPRTTRSQSRITGYNTRMLTPVICDVDEEGYVENKRKPGDYTLTDALLSTKYSRWVQCHTCDDDFVQQDAYHTRKECPRCERHSKLYGYAWPKTDKEGKHDKEERILDHRTIHRFVDPDEEKSLKKGRKALKEYVAARLSTPRSSIYRESSVSTAPDSGRYRRRVRKTM